MSSGRKRAIRDACLQYGQCITARYQKCNDELLSQELFEVITQSTPMDEGLLDPVEFLTLYRWPQKKSKELRSGEGGGQAAGPSSLIHLPGSVALRWLRTAIEKCAGLMHESHILACRDTPLQQFQEDVL
ncbi:hypothetical protein TNCV_727701 [Trichonephila clavipes]|nr:hypothetical protein TNCV_727701 [Trichonephila clavipes]